MTNEELKMHLLLLKENARGIEDTIIQNVKKESFVWIIDEAIKACEQRWIPVSERLPEDGTWNMFTDGKQISVERFKLDAFNHFFPEGRWFSFDEAVAWMPLPQSYEPQESEDKQ